MIRLKFFGLGLENEIQAYVKIKNKKEEILFEGYTYNGELFFCLKENEIYEVTAISGLEMISKWFYVDTKTKDYYFYFPRSLSNERMITFHLTDSFYKNLKIEKGEIYVQNNNNNKW